MAGIFKAYDIRGIYGKDLTDELAYRIGRAYVTFLKPRKVVIGYDMRPHSKPLFEALARGITEQGADVINLGLCTTPMSYFANGRLGADGSLIITASHNPGEWNGFKLCREQAIPISGATGIQDIEQIATEGCFAPVPEKPGTVSEYDILPEYISHIRQYARIDKPLRVAVDMANAMGIMESEVLKDLVTIDPLFGEYDGTFPNHEANPLKVETMEALQHMVRNGQYDFGISFDGDADRAGFVDENGNVVPMDIITALVAKVILENYQGPIYYDLRSSWAVREVIEAGGGTPLKSRVGHAFIKQQMRDVDAKFAGELSGHYYFRDNYYAESSSLAALYIASLICETGNTLSELVNPIQRYFASGEINSTVQVAQETVFERLRQRFPNGIIEELDGLSIEFDDWWFNVRASNTEPLIRLNLEAKTQQQMEEKRDEVLAVIRE
jgi:phosphomannomutase